MAPKRALGVTGTEVTKEASDGVLAERALYEEATAYLLDLLDLTAKRSLLGAR
jgi:hypothetical protein